MGFSFFFCEVVFCRFGPSSINEPNQNGPYVSLSHVIGPDVTEIPFRPNKSYSWARIPAAGRLSQAVAASFSTPAPPEAEHRGVAAAAAAAALQMKGGGGGERRIISEMERTVVAGVDRLNASHGGTLPTSHGPRSPRPRRPGVLSARLAFMCSSLQFLYS